MGQEFLHSPSPAEFHAEHTLRALTIPRFCTIPQRSDRHVVIPDLHGEHKVAHEIIDRYIDREDVSFVFLGDVVDRKGVQNDTEKGVYRTIECIKQLGDRAILTMANHEWTLLAALCAKESSQREMAQRILFGPDVIRQQEQNVLSAYDIETPFSPASKAQWLRTALQRFGHLAVLQSATPYYETTDFIAVHAGINPSTSWEAQREYLEDVAENMSDGLYYERPPQWFSMPLATSTQPIDTATEKIVVSGHAHKLVPKNRRNAHGKYSEERSLHKGKRIRLASSLNRPGREPAYIWQDWDRRIVEIKRTPAN